MTETTDSSKALAAKPDRELTCELREICRELLQSDDQSIIPAIKKLGIVIPKVRQLEAEASSTTLSSTLAEKFGES